MNNLDVHAAAIAAGDAGAFGQFLADAEQPLRRSLASYAARVDTEAVLQESLLRLWQIAPRFVSDGKPNGLFRLAHTIAIRCARDALRRARSVVLEERDEPSFEPCPPDPLLRRLIHECREALPDKPALALTARIESAGGESDVALATSLGMQPNTFLQNFTRARKLLADCLKKGGVDAALLEGA